MLDSISIIWKPSIVDLQFAKLQDVFDVARCSQILGEKNVIEWKRREDRWAAIGHPAAVNLP